MGGKAFHLLRPHDFHVLLQKLHQGARIQLLLLLRPPALPAKAQLQAAGGLHGIHQAVHLLHPAPAVLNFAADLLADGIGQDILEKLPIPVA